MVKSNTIAILNLRRNSSSLRILAIDILNIDVASLWGFRERGPGVE